MNANRFSVFTARLIVIFVLFFVVGVSNKQAAATGPILARQDKPTENNLVKNGAFTKWKNESPVDWKVDIGANDGANNPKSKLTKGDGPSLQLSGNAKTRAWKFVSQSIDVASDSVVRVSFAAKASGLRREGRQKNNCYVGLVPKNKQGKNVSPVFWTIGSREFQQQSEMASIPKDAVRAEIWIFLSKTGTLNVSDLQVEVLDPKDSFDILVADMARNYSFFDHKKVDWNKLSQKYRHQAVNAASPKVFSKVVAEMLGELNDMHTWVMHNKLRYSGYKGGYDANCDFNVVAKKLIAPTPYNGLGIFAKTDDDFCYINLRTLLLQMPMLRREPITPDFVPSDKPLREILDRVKANLDAPGMILDIRQNTGGDERLARRIAGMFIDKETVYAKSVFRNGPNRSDFGEPFSRVVRPAGKKTYQGPVVCLIGPGTVSSAEGLAMMMKAAPHCTLVGKPTRGASGSPHPIKLPNGVEVWYSRWKSLLPDGTCIEDVGIKPDIEVDHEQRSDLTFDKAVEILRNKQK